eukprot:CAMPEP_0119330144 /NCGR_PEP_ID=MMETSP1333-20130426/77625_1 /TAXON_ID=418940 /ORGANISM="Scyphosphaera apsteinii, Strain RCC1455" /LENGTH=399 /DNA_ID=CAMNT_0007339465 /DNA_START=183 /DNA_END=1382 /DNA_ORIENTATION=-
MPDPSLSLNVAILTQSLKQEAERTFEGAAYETLDRHPTHTSAMSQVASSDVNSDDHAASSWDVWVWRGLLLIVTACWGANFPVIKASLDVLDSGDGPLFVAARFLLSAVVLAPCLIQASSSAALRAGAEVGLWCAFGYATQAVALALGSQANTAAFICSMQAVVVTLVAASKEGVHARTWLAVALAVAGIACLEVPGILAEGPLSLCPGDLFALGQPIGFGMSYIVLERAIKNHPDDALQLSAMQCLLIALTSLSVLTASTGMAPWQLPWSHLLPSAAVSATDVASAGHSEGAVAVCGNWLVPAAVGYTGLVSTALTMWLQASIFKRLPAVDASIILSTEPLWATGFGMWLLGEAITGSDIMGGALIVSALLANEGVLEKASPMLAQALDATTPQQSSD